MEILNEIGVYAGYALVLIGGLLALDNAVDMVAKALGNKDIDTQCAKIGMALNSLRTKLMAIPTPTNETLTVTKTGV